MGPGAYFRLVGVAYLHVHPVVSCATAASLPV